MTNTPFSKKAFESEEIWTEKDNEEYNKRLQDYYGDMLQDKAAKMDIINTGIYQADEEHLDDAMQMLSEYTSEFESNREEYFDAVLGDIDSPWGSVTTENNFAPGITSDTLECLNENKAFEKYCEKREDSNGKKINFENLLKNAEKVGEPRVARKEIPYDIIDMLEESEQPTLFDELEQ